MTVFLVYSEASKSDLESMRRWYNQPGAGQRAKEKAIKILRSVRELKETAGTHQVDRFNPNNRQLVVEDHVVSYYMVKSASGHIYIHVDRVYGPGQDRTITECTASNAVLEPVQSW